MTNAIIDGIATRYEVLGRGPPLLMFSPGGFDATLEKWSTQGIYAKIKPLDHLAKKYTCIIYDRRECGLSGGRVEAITWSHYVSQAKGLLDHLGIKAAHLMGGCMGCCPVTQFAVSHPGATLSMILFWPVGGAKYRINGHQRIAEHMAFVREQGLSAVAALVAQEGKAFNADPRGGPWASVIKHDHAFAEVFAKQDVDGYLHIVEQLRDNLLDRDSAPGAEPEDMLRLSVPTLIVPGRDASHATSAARYLEECIPGSEYWDVPVEQQTEENTCKLLLDFLQRASPSH